MSTLKKYKIIILLAIVIALGALIYFFANPKSEQLKTDKQKVNLFSALVPDQITKITAGSVTLVKTTGQWQVKSGDQSYAAAGDLVDEALTTLTKVGKADVVSTKQDKWTSFEVDDNNGIKVGLFKADQALLDFVIGKEGAAWQSQYLRLKDKPEVYLVNTSLKNTFDRTVTDWRDKKVLALDIAIVQQITLATKEETITLVKKDNTWQATEPESFTPQADVATAFAASATNIIATDFATGEEAEKFAGNEKATITIKAADKQYEIKISQPESDVYLLQKTGEETVYKIGQYIADGLIKTLADFKG